MNLFLPLINNQMRITMNRQQRRKLERQRKKSQRGTLRNHIHFKKIPLSEIYNPMIDLREKGIQRKYELPNPGSLRMNNYIKRSNQYPPLDGQDGFNCFGFPNVDLGNVDEDIVDSVENSCSDPITFHQLEHLNSPRMVSPNGTLFPWGRGIQEDHLEKLVIKDPEIFNRPVHVHMRTITNSHVFPLTEKNLDLLIVFGVTQ